MCFGVSWYFITFVHGIWHITNITLWQSAFVNGVIAWHATTKVTRTLLIMPIFLYGNFGCMRCGKLQDSHLLHHGVNI